MSESSFCARARRALNARARRACAHAAQLRTLPAHHLPTHRSLRSTRLSAPADEE